MPALLRTLSALLLTTHLMFHAAIGHAAALDPNAFTSLGTFSPGSNVSVNTDTLAMTGGATFTGVTSGNIAVFTFASVTLNSGVTITATGSRSFALLSRGGMTISGTIDVSAVGATRGAGGHNGNSAPGGGPGSGPGAGGGDAQGSGGAGFGANGGSTTSGAQIGLAYGNLATLLEGGSGGGKCTFFGSSSGSAGGGGGALELGAINTMSIQGTAILRANGANGANHNAGVDGDGGAGGSGGALFLHGNPTNLASGAQLRANGGNGGNGSPSTVTGGVGGGGGAGGRILVTNVGTNSATITATGGSGGAIGGFGTGLPGGNGDILVPTPPSVTVTQSGGTTSVTEGGATDTYTVVLGGQPTANVTITISPNAQVTVSPTTLTYTTVNWNVAQTVTVTAVDDLVAEGTHNGSITHSASGGGYNGVAIDSVTPSITDNDSAGVTIAASSGTTLVSEAGTTDTYSVVLTSQPTASVTVTATPDAQVTVGPSAILTFTTGNWNQPQSITVSAVNDLVAEGTHNGTITHAASGGGYTGVSIANLVASITDNDTASVTVTQSGGTTLVTEAGGTDTYTIVLGSQPTSTVTVTPTVGAQLNAVGALTFTTANWNVAQTVTVSAVNDAIAEGTHLDTITHGISGGGYGGVAVGSVTVSITDNDTAGVTVTPSGGSTLVAEGGAGDGYMLVLTSQPTANVTVSVSVSSQVTRTPATRVFTPANWNVAQSISVAAVDDAVAEGNHSTQLDHTASGGGYDGIVINPMPVSITDNDIVAVTVTESAPGTTVQEGGSGDTYSIALASEPTDMVIITITPGSQLTTVPSIPLQFTPANWQTPQQVVVSAIDDAIDEGTHTGTITHSVSGANYQNATAASITAQIGDNDTRGVLIAESGNSTTVSESGTTDQYTIVLQSQPTGTVSIQVMPNVQVSVDTTDPMLFTTANWNVPQTVTVNAIDDATFEGAHIGTITHSASGGGYSGTPIASVTAQIADNDVQSVDLSAALIGLNPVFGPGERIRFELSIEHLTASALPGTAQVVLNLPPELVMVGWLCAADPGASCPTSGTTALNHLISLDGATGVTYIVTTDVSLQVPTGTSLQLTGMVSAQSPDADSNTSNNSSVLTILVGQDRMFRDGFEQAVR